ncbi:MAG: hypothetical protein IJ493_12165 [Clostridia bacterium]|nr:hypothetical protein [Clostridia bacterium]
MDHNRDNEPNEIHDKEKEIAEPSLFGRNRDLKKWWENFWYHYKFQTLIGLVLVLTVIICTTQLATKDDYDYYVMYAGPQIMAVQDITYIQRGIAEVAGDYNGDGQSLVCLSDVVMLSPEEQVEAAENGAVFDAGFLRETMTQYYQEILAGDAVICLLSPYMYEIVHEADGFMPLAEIFTEIPEAAYDDCGIVLSKTEFGQHFMGIKSLPEDTILCIRRISTFKNFKGSGKTEKHYNAYLELFRDIVAFEAPETEAAQ